MDLEGTSGSPQAGVLDAILELTSELDGGRLLQRVTELARELVGARYAALGVVSADGTELVDFVHSGMSDEQVEAIGELPRGGGILGELIRHPEPLRLTSIAVHPASVGFPPHHPPMEAFLGVPIRGREGVVGNLYLTEKQDADGFSEEDERLVLALAAQAAVAIENSRSYERERDMVDRMQSLVAANLALTKELRPDAVLQTLVDVARHVGGAEYAALGVLDDSGDALSAFVHSGMDPDLVARIGPLPRGLGVLGAVIVAGHPIRLHDLTTHPDSVGFPPGHPPMHAFLGVPLEFQGEVFGNLYLTNKVGGGDFTDEDEAVVAALAAQAAVAIENARLYEREQVLVEELRVLDEARSAFVSTVSHELRSPIAALSGLSQTLDRYRDHMSPEEIDESLDAIDRQATRLNRLVEQLLDLSRIESGQFAVSLEPVELAPLVETAVDGLVGDGNTLEVTVPAALVVRADPGRLDQILINLITNADHHGGDAIEVFAATTERPDLVELVVRDDGPGIPEALASRLFERFARGKGAAGGTGLGLAISQALAEAMGGSLQYRRRGGRTEFALTLPREPSVRPPVPE